MFSFKKKQTSEAVVAGSVHNGSSASGGKSRKFNVDLRIALVGLALAVIVFGSLGAAGYFYNEYKKLSQKTITPADELTDVLEKVSRIVELPEGENPTLATVSDVSKLSGQKFFEKAQNGDKVLIYTQASTAYLFRPATGKVVNVSQLDVKNEPSQETLQTSGETAAQSVAGDETETSSLETETTETASDEKPVVVKIALYNGSAKVGVTNIFEEEIASKFENVEVVMKERAAKNDYQGNLIVDLSGKNTELAQKLIDTFGGATSALPDGETKPEADILVIIGNKK